MAIEKSFNLKNQKTTQKIGNNFGLFKDTSFVVIRLNRIKKDFWAHAEARKVPSVQKYWQRNVIFRGGNYEIDNNYSYSFFEAGY